MSGTLTDINEWDMIGRVVGAAMIGGLLGWEREESRATAGIRTHMLVAAGAALFVAINVLVYNPNDEIPTRILGGIATGVGFIGGGAIVKDRGCIRGLTTAAGIWTVAGIGAAVGFGFWLLALFTALFALAMHLADYVVSRALGMREEEEVSSIKDNEDSARSDQQKQSTEERE